MSYGDTPKHDVDLCKTCLHSAVMKGRSYKEELRVCRELPPNHWPQHVVTTCSMWVQKTSMSKWDMEKLATIIEVNKKGQFVGFRPPNRDEVI